MPASIKASSENHSGDVNKDSETARFAFHIPSESDSTISRNRYSPFPGTLIHMPRIPHVSLAIDDHCIVLLQIDRYRDLVVLIPLIALQLPEFNVIQVAFYDLLVEGRVIRPCKNNMHVGAV